MAMKMLIIILVASIVLFLILLRPFPYLYCSPTANGTWTELQTLVDNQNTITLDKSYIIDRTLVLSRTNLTIDGNGFSVQLSPEAGTAPVILITNRTPDYFCKHTSAEWDRAWPNSTWEATISIKNLHVLGNLQSQTLSRTERLEKFVCSCPSAKLPPLSPSSQSEIQTTCSIDENGANREHSRAYGAISLLGVTDSPSGCADKCVPGCKLVQSHSCVPGFATNYDILANASAITMINARTVSLSNVSARFGRSAGVSCFFGCGNISLVKCTMQNNFFDGFGPDMLRDATLTECVFGCEGTPCSQANAAAVSVSAGALGHINIPKNFFGKITMSDCSVVGKQHIGLYANSPNDFTITEVHKFSPEIIAQIADGKLAKFTFKSAKFGNFNGALTVDKKVFKFFHPKFEVPTNLQFTYPSHKSTRIS